jgi:hypothetical protein
MQHTVCERILVLGMYRSASTRAYNLCRSAVADRSLAVGWVKRTDLHVALSGSGPFVHKAHVLSAESERIVREGSVRLVGTIRSPMDSLVSAVATFGWSPDVAASRQEEAIATLESLAPLVAIWRYRDLVAASPTVDRSLLRSVGIEVGGLRARRIARTTGRAASADRASSRPPGSGPDPVTLLHPGHVGPDRVVGPDVRSRLVELVAAHRFRERFENLVSIADGHGVRQR